MNIKEELRIKILKAKKQLEFVKEMQSFDANHFSASNRSWVRIIENLERELFILHGAVWALLESELDERETFEKESA